MLNAKSSDARGSSGSFARILAISKGKVSPISERFLIVSESLMGSSKFFTGPER